MNLDGLKSKKLWVLIGATLLLIGKVLFPELADLDTTQLMGLAASYLVGQGIADHGKEKAKIETKTLEAVTSRQLDIVGE